MESVINLNNVKEYNDFFGLETLHPLVSVVDLSKCTRHPKHFTFNYGVYALFLKNTRCGDLRYGRQTYDYQEGTVTSFAPGQVVEVTMDEDARPSAIGLLFHPDIIHGTPLGAGMKQYSFFSYSSSEALHLSEEEKTIFTGSLENIKRELSRPVDKHSKRLISKNIELLLDYCLRFYERQFTTRTASNKDILTKFEILLDDYYTEGKVKTQGLPTVRYFAEKVFLSPNYFGDLIKRETGRTAQEHIQSKIIHLAEEMIASTTIPVSTIANELGFQYSQHFNRLFKKNTGHTPSEYRKLQN